MNKEIQKERTKRWNKFRISLGNANFTRSELSALAKMEGLNYYSTMPNELIKKDNLIFVGKKCYNKNQECSIYRFSQKPIHFSVIIAAVMKGKGKKISKIVDTDVVVYNDKDQCSNTVEPLEKKSSQVGEFDTNKDMIEDILNDAKNYAGDFTKMISPYIANIISKRTPKFALEVLQNCKFKIAVHIELDLSEAENVLGNEANDIIFRISNEHKIPIVSTRHNDMRFAIDYVSNKDLVEELRIRGVDVKAKQVIEL